MANKINLSTSYNLLTMEKFEEVLEMYRILRDLNLVLPESDEPIYPFRTRKISLYTKVFEYCNYRISFTIFLTRVLTFHKVHITQVNPFG
ncbi:hypothetical protein Hanom_Chr14g01323621 [Helianthus anomalus]